MSGGIHKFFEHGEVRVTSLDAVSRQTAIAVCMPSSLMQAVIPTLLGAGTLDRFVIMNPLSAWMPAIGNDHIRHDAIVQDPDLAARLNSVIREKIEDIMNTFKILGGVLIDPSDLIPMLPIGIYVQFRLRCGVDSLAVSIIELDGSILAGISEFKYALAAALAEVLQAFGEVSDGGQGSIP